MNITCSFCGKKLLINDKYRAAMLRCKGCGNFIQVTLASTTEEAEKSRVLSSTNKQVILTQAPKEPKNQNLNHGEKKKSDIHANILSQADAYGIQALMHAILDLRKLIHAHAKKEKGIKVKRPFIRSILLAFICGILGFFLPAIFSSLLQTYTGITVLENSTLGPLLGLTAMFVLSIKGFRYPKKRRLRIAKSGVEKDLQTLTNDVCKKHPCIVALTQKYGPLEEYSIVKKLESLLNNHAQQQIERFLFNAVPAADQRSILTSLSTLVSLHMQDTKGAKPVDIEAKRKEINTTAAQIAHEHPAIDSLVKDSNMLASKGHCVYLYGVLLVIYDKNKVTEERITSTSLAALTERTKDEDDSLVYLSDVPYNERDNDLKAVVDGAKLMIGNKRFSRWMWFSLANMAILVPFYPIFLSDPASLSVIPFFLFFSSLVPFGMLWLSKIIARTIYDMRILNDTEILNKKERQLKWTVNTLAYRAGLAQTPEIAIYESPDMNAFATGPSRNNAIIAFSTALVEKMNSSEMAAIAAHEIAHIANGDMVTMALVQSVVNVIFYMITLPMWIASWFVEEIPPVICLFIAHLVHYTLLIAGYIVVMAFSRKREYAADALGAQLTSTSAMVSALRRLKLDISSLHIEKNSLVCLKVSSDTTREILSSHPSLVQRIRALTESD